MEILKRLIEEIKPLEANKSFNLRKAETADDQGKRCWVRTTTESTKRCSCNELLVPNLATTFLNYHRQVSLLCLTYTYCPHQKLILNISELIIRLVSLEYPPSMLVFECKSILILNSSCSLVIDKLSFTINLLIREGRVE